MFSEAYGTYLVQREEGWQITGVSEHDVLGFFPSFAEA